jgi:hypothetical protein
MRSRVVARSPALRAACCATSVPQHVPPLLEQGGARDGELDAALAAVEELDPELLLEFAHLLAYCRLRDVKALRCPAEVQFLGDGDEVPQMPKLHCGSSPTLA